MIKIQIADPVALKTAYLPIVQADVIETLGYLKISLNHLQDPDNINDDDIVSVKSFTKAIVDTIRMPKTPNSTFNKPVYRNAIATYPVGATRILPVDWVRIINLIDHLLDDTNGSLRSILIGDPLTIKQTNDALLQQFGITARQELNILKNGFDYGGETGANVRQFFYDKNLTAFCAYCNISRARHTTNRKTGNTSDQFHLDHFFSQTDHPLLALSLFNLVPSDPACNVENKGSILFSDALHLNPYISGFKRDMVFHPLLDDMGDTILEFELKINVDRASDRWKQLIGDEDALDMAPEHGNLNVFEIYTKYNCDDLYFQMGHLMKDFVKVAKNERSLREILEVIETDENDAYANFKSWFESRARTCFHEKEFGRHAFSKLHRDLLDFVYQNYPENFHDTVHNILETSYDPVNGGE